MSENNSLIPSDTIEHSILLIRGQRVMLDSVLAKMYEVEVKRLNEAVKRNILRFPRDFMFQLSKEEYVNLRFQFGTSSLKSQIATSKSGDNRGGKQKLPYVFTEYGVAMLSSVLRSDRAIAVNIEIMRAFGKYRSMLVAHRDLARKISDLEKSYDGKFAVVFHALNNLNKLIKKPDEKEKEKGHFGFSAK